MPVKSELMESLREIRMETRGLDFGLKGSLTGKEQRQKSNTGNNKFRINTSLVVLNSRELQRQYQLRGGQQRGRAAGSAFWSATPAALGSLSLRSGMHIWKNWVISTWVQGPGLDLPVDRSLASSFGL